jgi:hypothetical protein
MPARTINSVATITMGQKKNFRIVVTYGRRRIRRLLCCGAP